MTYPSESASLSERRIKEREKWDEYYSGPHVSGEAPPPELADFGLELAQFVERLLPDGGKVLEAGSGGGWQSAAIARRGVFDVHLLDFSENALAASRAVFERESLRACFRHEDIFDQGTPEFDLVFNSGVIEHYSLAEQAELLRGMASRSRKWVLVLAPNRGCYWYWAMRLYASSQGNWPFGKEAPVSELSAAFDAASIRLHGHAYLGRRWTERFLEQLPGLPEDVREILLKAHRSPLIPESQACYLVAALGSVNNGEPAIQGLPVKRHSEKSSPESDELAGALADALSLSVAAEHRIAALNGDVSRLEGLLESQRSIEQQRTIEQQLRSAAAYESRIDALTAETSAAAQTQRELAGRISELMSELDGQRRLNEEQRARGLASEERDRRKLRDYGDEVLRLQRHAAEVESTASTALSQYRTDLDLALQTFRSQRAWKLMLAARKAYSLSAKGGLRGAARLLAWIGSICLGRPAGLEAQELRFPAPPQLGALAPPGTKPGGVTARRGAQITAKPGDRYRQGKYDVIILAIIDFDFRYQRPQQIAAEFARQGHRVFWVSPTRLLAADASEPYATVALRHNLWEVRLRGVQQDIYMGELAAAHAKSFTESLGSLASDWSIAANCALVQLPFWRQLALNLRANHGSKIVYDCMDEWDTFENLGKFNVREEEKLAAECDVLTVTAQKLSGKFEKRGLSPLLVRNGADFDFFRGASEPDSPPDLARPIIGYFGAIADWIDLDLVVECARARPNYTFVMAGQVFGRDTSELQKLPNVRMLGHVPYESIPSLLRSFDVCQIPFLLNEVTQATDPVKLYEYFTHGSPVVATKMSELTNAGDLVYIAQDRADYVRQLDAAARENDGQLRERRIDFARRNTWGQRVAVMDRAIAQTYAPVSILIVTYNSADYVLPCLESIKRNTAYPNYEVLVVDNGSRDGTVEQLNAFAGTDDRVRTVLLDRNAGFSGANNEAARRAKGSYLVLLNADTIVTPGWLDSLMEHMRRDPAIGLISPVTNFAGNEVKIDFDYTNEEEMELFALQRNREHGGQASDIAVVPLFCALIQAPLFASLGGLDEGYEVGMFEDDDFSARVRSSGLRVCMAEDCFVHHFGQGSFGQLPSERYAQIFEQNRQRYEQKWKRQWTAHRTRPNVRPPLESRRFRPGQFCTRLPKDES